MDPILSHALAALGGLAAGALITWLVTRRNAAPAAEAEKKLGEYREQVAEHFARTATLVDGMTDSYKAVFDQLQEGAQKLMQPEQLEKLIDERSDEIVTLTRLSHRQTDATSGQPAPTSKEEKAVKTPAKPTEEPAKDKVEKVAAKQAETATEKPKATAENPEAEKPKVATAKPQAEKPKAATEKLETAADAKAADPKPPLDAVARSDKG